MQHITVDSSLRAKLTETGNQIIVCGSNGEVLGYFSPESDGVKLSDLQLEPPLSIEETKRLCVHRTGRPLEEILREFNL
jgi:hypothetical protein